MSGLGKMQMDGKFPLNVSCPECEAGVGEMCAEITESNTDAYHEERISEARRYMELQYDRR